MKSLIDKIIEVLQNRLNEDLLSNKEYFYKCAIHDAIEIIKKCESDAEFEEAARVLMKHLANGEKYHPNMTAIVESTKAEVLEGVIVVRPTYEYVEA